MSFAPWLAAPASALAAMVLCAPVAATDPDIDTESAAEVVTELREQGYDVEVKGVAAENTALLATCKVTAIHNPGDPTSDPTATTTIYVDVACPIQHS